jgi:alanine dehydrogenase
MLRKLPAHHHAAPTYERSGIVHYCVANMPGAVPVTSTHALANATLPYVLRLADQGIEGALERDAGLRAGLNVAAGRIVNSTIAAELTRAAAMSPPAEPAAVAA